MIQTMSTILNNHLGAIFSHPMVNNWAKKFRPPPPTCSIIPPSRRSVSSCRLWTSNCKTGYWDYGAKAKEARFESVGVHYANRGGCQSRRIGAYPSRWVRYGVVWSPIEKTAGISTKIGIVAQWPHQLWIPTSIWEETEYPPNAQQSLIPIAGEYACRWARIYCAGTLHCVTKQAHRCIHNFWTCTSKSKICDIPTRTITGSMANEVERLSFFYLIRYHRYRYAMWYRMRYRICRIHPMWYRICLIHHMHVRMW